MLDPRSSISGLRSAFEGWAVVESGYRDLTRMSDLRRSAAKPDNCKARADHAWILGRPGYELARADLVRVFIEGEFGLMECRLCELRLWSRGLSVFPALPHFVVGAAYAWTLGYGPAYRLDPMDAFEMAEHAMRDLNRVSRLKP